jgi:hypothetical protein
MIKFEFKTMYLGFIVSDLMYIVKSVWDIPYLNKKNFLFHNYILFTIELVKI